MAVGSDVVIGVPYSAEHVMKVNVSSNTVEALALSDDFTGNSAPTAMVRGRGEAEAGGARVEGRALGKGSSAEGLLCLARKGQAAHGVAAGLCRS